MVKASYRCVRNSEFVLNSCFFLRKIVGFLSSFLSKFGGWSIQLPSHLVAWMPMLSQLSLSSFLIDFLRSSYCLMSESAISIFAFEIISSMLTTVSLIYFQARKNNCVLSALFQEFVVVLKFE